ncbi:MAG: hypothetical protein AAF557_17485 [Pseudomonadota bacterium]
MRPDTTATGAVTETATQRDMNMLAGMRLKMLSASPSRRASGQVFTTPFSNAGPMEEGEKHAFGPRKVTQRQFLQGL